MLADCKKLFRNTHFTIQFCSNNLTHFTKPNSPDIEKMCSRNTTKNLPHFTNFPKASGWCHKKHLHCNISTHPRSAFSKHFVSKCLYIYVYLRKKICVAETVVSFYLGGDARGRLNNSLRWLAVWAS